MLDNIHVAILTKVNELAERHGIKPYDFCAGIHIEDPSRVTLKFEIPVSGNSSKVRSFNKMLDLLGFDEDTHSLTANVEQIVDALDNGLRLAPKPQLRR